VPNLVYAETGANVRLTMVAGEVICRDGEFTRIDAPALLQEVVEAASRFERDVAADPAVQSLPIVELTRDGRI
jgi:hypothetical protein